MSTYEKKEKNLKRIKKFELLNRLACYACIIPFFYATACLGKKETIPSAAKVGSVGFIATTVAAIAIRTKQEKIQEELEKAAKDKSRS